MKDNRKLNKIIYSIGGFFRIIKCAFQACLKSFSARSSSPKKARTYMGGKVKRLEEASNHLHYEINKIFEMYNYFIENPKNYTQIRIEVFLLHTRNLLEFFYPYKIIQKDTMCVFDFLDNYEEFNNKKTTKKDLDFYKLKDIINKYLSHISYKRCDSDFQDYPIKDIMEGMTKTIKAFYEALPDEYKNWDYIQRINDLVKNFKNKQKTNTSEKKGIMNGTTSSNSGVSIFGLRKLS